MDLSTEVRTPAGRQAIERLRAAPDQALIALDYDGVIAPIVARPEDAQPLPQMLGAMTALATKVGHIAVVTGRPAADAAARGLAKVPGLVILGHYGLERWEAGHVASPPDDQAIDDLRPALLALVRSAPEGTTLEDKGHSLAVHTRRTTDPAATLAQLRPAMEEVAHALDLEVVPGRYVLEVRPPGVDKGLVLTSLVEDLSASFVMYAGDDLGDLPAAAALDALRSRPRDPVAGLVVCSDSPETPQALREAADLVVPGPSGVLEVLWAIGSLVA